MCFLLPAVQQVPRSWPSIRLHLCHGTKGVVQLLGSVRNLPVLLKKEMELI